MALTSTKSVNLFGQSIVGDVTIMQLSATINYGETVTTSYTETIVNNELYQKNKREVRKDISDFKDIVYKLEDEAPGTDE